MACINCTKMLAAPSCRNLAKTRVPWELPDCAARDMPLLPLHGVQVPAFLDAPGRQAVETAVVAGLGLLASAAVLGPAAAALIAWRRRRYRPLPGSQKGQHESSASTEAVGLLAAKRRKRARLGALLRSELGGSQGDGIELLPMEVLPAALAHHLGSGQWTAAQTRGGSAAGSAVGPQGAATAGERHPLLAAGWAPSDAAGGDSSASYDARQWRLHTHSVCMSIGDLKVSRTGCRLLLLLLLLLRRRRRRRRRLLLLAL